MRGVGERRVRTRGRRVSAQRAGARDVDVGDFGTGAVRLRDRPGERRRRAVASTRIGVREAREARGGAPGGRSRDEIRKRESKRDVRHRAAEQENAV